MRFFRILLLGLGLSWALSGNAQDLAEIRERGVLRHLGVPYARFVSGNGEGLDVEIVQLFAKHLGVRYEYVPAEWYTVIQDLIGQELETKPKLHAVGSRSIRGDIIGNGLTILPERKNVLDFSEPTFPSAVWLIARSNAKATPITPTGSLEGDIRETKKRLREGTTFVKSGYCIDGKLYDLEGKGYALKNFAGNLELNDIIPALLKGEADMSLLDVPDVIVGMEKWAGQIKVIGPISEEQSMAAGFRKTSPELRKAFNEFFAQLQRDGTYMMLVNKYYRSAPRYLPNYFRTLAAGGR